MSNIVRELALLGLMTLFLSSTVLFISPFSSASSSSASPSSQASTAQLAATLSKLQVGPAQTVKNVKTMTKSPSTPIIAQSGNWAGFVAVPPANGKIVEVTADWYVPHATCSEPSGNAEYVEWVGIDGWGSGTVEQDGTIVYCSGPGATPSYSLWWEFFPYNGIQICSTCSGVNAGDWIQAYVLYNPDTCLNGHCGVYTLNVIDLFNYGIQVTVTGQPWVCNSGGACQNGVDHSAECISEDPTASSGSLYTLVNYGKTTFYACAASINGHFQGIGSFSSKVATVYKVTQIGPVSKSSIQVPSGLSSYYYGKSEFSVTWKGYD